MPKSLTARQIATAPTGKHRVDRGLYLLISPSNARSWIFRGWDGTREIVRGLGAVADVPLTAARQAAVRLRAGLLDGAADLPRRGRAVRAIVHTWRDVFARLSALKANGVRPSTLRAQNSIWNVHVEPVFGSRDVKQTTMADVVDAINAIEGSSQLKARKQMRELGGLAVSLGWVGTNPANGEIDAALAATAKRHGAGNYRSMPHAMIPAWLRSLTPGPIANLITMLVLTAARLEDVRSMTWSEVDGDTWTVSGERHKSGADFAIPLSAPVLAILERQRGRHDRFVFPGMRATGRPISAKMIRKSMHADFDLHGFRGAFKGWTAETGIDDTESEYCLAHRPNGTRGRYYKTDLIDARRALMAKWATYVAVAA